MKLSNVRQLEVIDQRVHDREHHNSEQHGRRHAMRAFKATGDDMTVVIAEAEDGAIIKIYLSDTDA